MSYTPPSGSAVEFELSGVSYTAPAGSSVDFQLVGTGLPVAVGHAVLTISAAGVATFTAPFIPIIGDGAVTLAITAAGVAKHGVAGSGAAALAISAHGVAVHPRYELKGIVKLAGSPVNRRVRVYDRATGALAYEQDTTLGAYNIHAGFSAGEYYILPIHLDDAAVDWKPPCANRVLSVLVQD